MRWQVRAGADDMPAFGPDKISDADLEALLAYTETFGATHASSCCGRSRRA